MEKKAKKNRQNKCIYVIEGRIILGELPWHPMLKENPLFKKAGILSVHHTKSDAKKACSAVQEVADKLGFGAKYRVKKYIREN